MFIKLKKIEQAVSGEYYLSEVVINTAHITFMTEDYFMKSNLMEGKINIGLNEAVEFTKIRLSSNRSVSEITVIGDINLIERKMIKKNKKLLWG